MSSTAFLLSGHLEKVDSDPFAPRIGADGPWIGPSTDGDKWRQVMKSKGEKEAWTWGLAVASLSQPCNAAALSHRGWPDTKAFYKAVFLKLWLKEHVFSGSGPFFSFLFFCNITL